MAKKFLKMSQLSDSSKKRKIEKLEQVSQSSSSVKRVLFEEPVTSAHTSSAESSPEKITLSGSSPQKSIILQSSSASSLASNLSSSQIQGSSSSDNEVMVECKDTYLQKISIDRTLLVIENHSRFYLGLPKDTYFIVKLLQD